MGYLASGKDVTGAQTVFLQFATGRLDELEAALGLRLQGDPDGIFAH